MKITLLILVLFSLNFQSQNYYFKFPGNIENSSINDNIKKLNVEILRIYKNGDKIKFNDNIFRLYILNGDYKKGLFYLNELKGFPKYKGLDYQEIIGIQFELYALSKLSSENKSYRDKFENTFNRKINSISDKSKIYLGDFFRYTEEALKNDILKFIKTDVVNDSISEANAVKLCRYYISYIIAKETNHIALPLIEKVDREEYAINDSVIIKTKSGNEISLGFLRYKKGENKVPTILNFSIYNRRRLNNNEKLNSLRGYAIVNAYSRGVYLSHDQITPFEFEIEDVNEVIDWITKQSWSDGKVGMIGGSYDGFSQWAAAKNLHPALKTIIPSASVGFGVDFPMYNNCFSPYMLRWLSYVDKKTHYEIFNDEKKWLSVYNSYYKNGTAFNKLDSIYGKTNVIFQKWLKHPSFDEYWRSKMPYKRDFAKINIPVLTLTGYYDADQRGAMYYYDEHHKYNKNANHYLVIGPYGHSGVISGINEEYNGYKIDSVAKINIEEISFQWFDYILKEKKKPKFLKDKVNYQVMGSNQWKSASKIDQISNGNLKLFLNKTKLEETEPKLDYISQMVSFSDRADTLRSFNDEKVFNDKISPEYLKDRLVFESDVFENSFEINGSFTGNLKTAINKKDMDLILTVYEKLSSGKYLKLSHESFARASYAKDNTKRNLLRPNVVENIPIKNTFFTSRKVEKGSRIIVVLGIRKSADTQINYGTGKDVSEETIADAKEPLEIKWYNDSYIEIPVMQN
ncbi:CocE/NonD family hydrolase [Chryseobacterium sp. SN22]|uniref:CocE/NonD family hydrolase n=1 Tax=Chryseobacterium sp. SN22 TaxID=2606431 RepID=UPI001623CA51|nr:CocE/NonD family hydrolase [Chryseobacterium sp. SN22]